MFTALTVLTMLIGALAPVFDGTVSAQTVTPPDAGNGGVQATETPQDQQQPPPTADTSMQTPTETPTATVANELLGAVNISYWECPAGTDPASVQASALQSTCTNQRDGVNFAITDGNGGSQSQQTGYYDTSQIGFTEIPIGNISFGQMPAPVSAVVLCDGIVQHGGPETGTMQLQVSNGMVSWNLKDDEIVFCNWYVGTGAATTATATASASESATTTGMTETPAATSSEMASSTPQNELIGAVNIAYWECPSGTDPATVQLSDLETTCRTQRNGLTFNVTDGNGATQNQQTGYYDDSQIGFSGLAIGNISFGPSPASSSAIVLCDGIVQHGGPETGTMQLTVSNGTVAWDLKDDEIVFCNWYAGATAAMPASPTASPMASGTPVNQLVGSINITYHECPAAFDLTNPPSDPSTACTTQRNGVQFDLVASTSQTFSQLTGYYDDSVVSFTEIPTGSTKVTQNPAAQQSLVICNGIVQHGGPETGQMTMPVTNGSITWNLKDDEIVGCDWYTDGVGGAGTQPASLSVTVYNCPSTFDLANATASSAQSGCVNTQRGIRLDLGDTNGPVKSLVSDANGRAAFGAVVPGPYTLQQYPIPSVAKLFCTTTTGQGTPAADIASDVPNGAATLSLDPGVSAQCSWYMPQQTAGTGTVYINKHACPASYVPSSPPDIYDLALNCNGDAGSVNFYLEYPGGSSAGSTTGGQLNALQFNSITSGIVLLTEGIPQGYGTPIVTCKGMSLTNDPAVEVPSTLLPVNANAVTWNLLDTQTMFCDWYNIPSGYGSVTINKHACPTDYMVPNPVDPYDLALKCHDDAGPVNFTIANGTYSTTGTTSGAPNLLSVDNVPSGTVSLTETIPAGFTSPIVYCKGTSLTQDPALEVPFTLQQVSNGTISWHLLPGQMLYCDWWNVHQQQTYSVTIYKYTCGNDPSYYMTNGVPDYQKFTTLCTNPMPGVNFTASQNGTPVATATSSNSNPFSLSNLPVTTTTVAETLPSGYGQPYVFCGDAFSPTQQLVTNGSITLNPTGSGNIVCSWYNMPDGPGSITVYKWLCPEGYDWTLPGANPKMDCATPQNGVTFSLYDSTSTKLGQSNTGDSIPYAIYYGGLPIGDYSLKETVPSGIGGIFVLDCTGLYTDSIHPMPLWTGNDFPFHIGSHDQLVCNWYNVPTAQNGGIVIHKSMCTTLTWISPVECDTWEYGASFTVSNGGGTVGQGTTDAWGKLAIGGLAAGGYTVTETSGSPCRVEMSVGGGQRAVVTNQPVQVEAGKTTDVWVYNCAMPPAPGVTPTPGGKGKPPMKFPNTGVDPNAGANQRPAQDTQVIEPETATPPSEMGTPQACTEMKDGTPVAATPEEGVRCGAVPVSIAATAIKLDAKIEVLETVNGDMEDPTTPDQAAWYKETAKLGAGGNTVMAGHLNYWGVPEGVFFALDTLKAGDTVQVTGNDGTVYTYIVDWVKQVDATVAPGPDIVGPTAQPSLTLMTCGGPWNSDVSEYTERTVVRAHLAGTGPAPEATPSS